MPNDSLENGNVESLAGRLKRIKLHSEQFRGAANVENLQERAAAENEVDHYLHGDTGDFKSVR